MLKSHGFVPVINFYFVTGLLPPFIFSGTRRCILCLQTSYLESRSMLVFTKGFCLYASFMVAVKAIRQNDINLLILP